jgi:hypothetical protein
MSEIPIVMPVEEELISVDEERARAAGWVQNAKLGDLLGCLALHELSDSLPDNVIHDVSGRVIDSARFLDLGLVLDDAVVSGCEPDDLAQELLVNMAEDIGRDDRKLIGTFRIIKPLEEIVEQVVVYAETERNLVGRLVAPLFSFEIKKP